MTDRRMPLHYWRIGVEVGKVAIVAVPMLPISEPGPVVNAPAPCFGLAGSNSEPSLSAVPAFALKVAAAGTATGINSWIPELSSTPRGAPQRSPAHRAIANSFDAALLPPLKKKNS